MYHIFVYLPASALSCRSETCDHFSVSANSMGIKTPRPLRTLREIYNHHTDVFFPHAENAKVAKILLITLSLEGSLAPRDKRAQRLAETSSYLLYSFVILPLRSPVVVKLATTSAPARTVWELKLRVLCALCVRHITTTRIFSFRLFLVSCSYLRICHKNIIFAFRNYKLGRL